MNNKIEEQKPAENKTVENTTPLFDAQKVLKEYNEIANYQKVLANHLLGKYNDNNEYKIADETILQALVEIPKQFQDKQGENVYACAKVAGCVLNFKIVYDIAESFCNADLYLIETESSFEETIKHETHLGSIVEMYSPKFQENTYNQWGVYKGEELKDKSDKLYSYLHMQEQEFLFNKELTEILSQLFVLRVLPLLNGTGEEGYNAVGEFNALVQKLVKDDPTLANDYTRLKLLLDRELKKKKLLEQILLNQEILRNMNAYSAPLKRVKDKTFTPMALEGKKEEKKKEEKKPEKKEEKKKAKKSSAKKEEEKKPKKAEKKKKAKEDDPEWLQKLENGAEPIGFTPAQGPREIKSAPVIKPQIKESQPQPAPINLVKKPKTGENLQEKLTEMLTNRNDEKIEDDDIYEQKINLEELAVNPEEFGLYDDAGDGNELINDADLYATDSGRGYGD